MRADPADEMFLIKIFIRLITFLALLALIIPLYFFGKTWWSAREFAKEYDLTQVAFDVASHTADVIVVLGAAQFDGRPGPVLKARLKTARDGYLKNLVTEGIPKSRIIAITQGRDTYSSTLAYSAAMKGLDLESALIVTDPYHCLRATTMAKDQGIKAQCLPTAYGLANIDNSTLRYLTREAGAYLAYVVLGRRGIMISEDTIDGLIPSW
jgi:uncharacterized SAM-binding protein YcdF (DUF218 family)